MNLELVYAIVAAAVFFGLIAVAGRIKTGSNIDKKASLTVGPHFEGHMITRETGKENQVTLWNPEWKIDTSAPSGRVEFDVKKPCGGLLVAFSSQYGSVTGSDSCTMASGIGLVLDGPHPRQSSYFCELPWWNAPSNASQFLMNSNGSHWMTCERFVHVSIVWANGTVQCYVDGTAVVQMSERKLGKYIGFGSLGSDLGRRGPPGVQHLGVVRNMSISSS